MINQTSSKSILLHENRLVITSRFRFLDNHFVRSPSFMHRPNLEAPNSGFFPPNNKRALLQARSKLRKPHGFVGFFSLNLIAENPNKVGLSYGSSMFHVLSHGLVVGLIRIPRFHQPPLSKNVSIEARVSVESVDVSDIMYRSLKKDDPSRGVSDGIRILGDVIAHVRIFRVTSPKIRIALDCNINVDRSRLSLSSEVYSMKWNHNHLISLPSISQSVSKKCSFAIVL